MPSSTPDRATHSEPGLLVPRAQLEADLSDRIAAGNELRNRNVAGPEGLQELQDDYYTWDEYNITLLKRSFTTSAIADTYQDLVLALGGQSTIAEQYRELVDDIAERIRRLKSIQSRLPLFSETQRDNAGGRRGPGPDAQDVFIVHGHNEAVRQSVARFIRQVTDHEPIILHEQANSGRTVIEKFEQHAGAIGFAVVLLTADDEGGKRGSGDIKLRARQNVILELGFFIGTLGRNRVAALHESGVELPSDVSGMLYTSLDSHWRQDLGREMRAAGLTVDLNKAL